MSDILVERDGPIATVVINRAAKLNAMTKPMWRALGESISELSADDSVRCIILRGAGEKSFSPGNDISEFETDRANREQAIEVPTKTVQQSGPNSLRKGNLLGQALSQLNDLGRARLRQDGRRKLIAVNPALLIRPS